MKSLFIFFFSLTCLNAVISQSRFNMTQWTDIKGYWSFDKQQNIWFDSSSYKNPLISNGNTPTTTAGFFNNDNAIITAAASPSNYLSCIPKLTANGGGNKVNIYTLMFDIKISSVGPWYSMLQTGTTASSDDGDIFIDPSGKVGIGAAGYSTKTILPDQWSRIVFVCNNNTTSGVWNIYIDGKQYVNLKGQGIDGRFSLPINSNPFYFFADDDNENSSLTCSAIAIWDRALSETEVATLGGYYVAPAVTYPIKPFLQTPTSSSIYISWLSSQTTGSKVIYGSSSSSLSLQKSGTSESISTEQWHTVKLDNLSPNSTYYYQCISGTDSSAITPFHTPPLSGTQNGHIIIAMNSDVHIGADRNATTVLTSMKNKFIELYGEKWYEKVTCIINNGDVFQNATLSELKYFYESYIIPISGSVPFMTTLGNHDLYTNPPTLYYQFLKYDDFSAFPTNTSLNEKYYSFILGNSLFITLNSETTNNSTQTTWLENKLIEAQNNASIDFVFINAHHPGKSEMWQVANNTWMQNTIYPILGKYAKVAMISHGHSHNYERGVIKSSNAENVDFRTLIIGGGGGWLDFWTDYSDDTDWPQTHRTIEGSHFVILDIDMNNKSYAATMYSLGSTSRTSTTTTIQDSFYGKKNQAAPSTPVAVSPSGIGSLTPILSASPFSGLDVIMSSQFQVTATPGTYTSPIINSVRDFENIFQSSGSPLYTPIDKNVGIDLTSFQVTSTLTQNKTYAWRVRYRDQNLKWSDWSDETIFVADATTLINENNIYQNFLLYPNPATTELKIETTKSNGDTNIIITNTLGQVVYSKPFSKLNHHPTNTIEIDVSQFSAGLYFIRVGDQVQKFVKE